MLPKKKKVLLLLCHPLWSSVVRQGRQLPTDHSSDSPGIPGLQPPAGASLKLTELDLPLPLSEHHHAQLGSLLGVSCPAAFPASWSKQLLNSPPPRPEGVCRWSSQVPIT